MCVGKVEVVKSYEVVLHAASWQVRMPSVVRLTSFVRRRRLRIAMTRRNIFVRDGNQCQYCQRRLSAAELTADHVTPRSQGGSATWENLVTACGPCNRRKGGRTPEEARMSLVRRPQRPDHLPARCTLNLGGNPPESWGDFIAWARDGAA